MSARPLRRSLAPIWLVLGLSACGSGEELPPPAEPAVSPPATVKPAGRIVALGAEPEGLAVDPESGLVAVGLRDPDRLALLEAATGRVVRSVDLPAAPRHLQLAAPGGPVLVPAEGANALVRVSLPAGRARTTSVGDFPHDASQAGGRVFVGDELGDTVTVVEGGRVVKTLPAPVQPGGVAALGDRLVGVVAVRGNVLELYDASTLESLGSAPAGSGPTHVVAGPEQFYVVDTRGDALLIFDPLPQPRLIRRVDLPGGPYGVALDRRRERVWVTLTERNEVVGYDLDPQGPRELARLPTVRQPNTVAVDPRTGRVIVAGRAGEELQLIGPGRLSAAGVVGRAGRRR